MTAVLGFEPDPEEARRLQMVGRGPWAEFSIEMAALGEREGPATLYLATEPNNHSLRPTNAEFVQRYAMEKFFPAGSVPLDTTTLDRVIFEKRGGKSFLGEFLKVDTQGTELEIFKGARRTLEERTKVVVCEVEFAPIYSGQALFSDVELFMRGFWLCLFWLFRIARAFPQAPRQDNPRRSRAIALVGCYFFQGPDCSVGSTRIGRE